MKKAISLILVLVMCLTLCACGNSKELEKYRKYETLINYIEAEDYQSAYLELVRISRGGENAETTEATEAKQLVTVDINKDNWQEYFEIRSFEETYYNDFGDLTGHNVGYGIYLKAEYLEKLAYAGPQLPNGSVDVSFKVMVTTEFREYDREIQAFVENGEIYSTEEEEVVIKAYDQRRSENTKTQISDANGQVCAKLTCGKAVSSDRYYEGVYTTVNVTNATGTLVFEE